MQLVYHYCPHNVGHHLGLEVHDVYTLSDSEPLAPGAVITIEPGAMFVVAFT
jgi:Xaa-Pro aminopeptidase